MKKIIIFTIILVFLLSFAGCSGKNKGDILLSSKDQKDISLDDNEDKATIPKVGSDKDEHTDSEDNIDNANDKNSLNDTDNNEDTKDTVDTGNADNSENTEKAENLNDNKNTEVTEDKEDSKNNEALGGTVETTADKAESAGDKTKENVINTSKADNSKSTDSQSKGETNESGANKGQKLSVQGELGKKLSLQMSNGEFKETYNTFSMKTKLQITLKILEQAWNEAVTDIGSYKGIREITEEASDTGTAVYVILDYDTSGIKITFYFNSLNLLDGLWLNLAPYEEIVLDDAFEEISITFGDKKNPIEGILTLPKKTKNPPVAILVHGSGTHDADETIGVNKPFRDLAHGLARKGIAVIRYKEPVVKSADNYTIQEDSLDAASQAIKYAQSCGKVNTDKIIVVGHSLGGMMAPKIAYDNKEVDAIVCLAGSPRRLEDIILDQTRILYKADESISEAVYKVALAQAEGMVKKVKELKESSSEMLLGLPASYWYSLNQIDIPSIAKDLDIPIYIAQGSEDFQVYADIDYVAWKQLLKNKDNVMFRLYDGLNHLFMTANGRMDTTEYNIKGTVSQKLIDDIAKWILNK